MQLHHTIVTQNSTFTVDSDGFLDLVWLPIFIKDGMTSFDGPGLVRFNRGATVNDQTVLKLNSGNVEWSAGDIRGGGEIINQGGLTINGSNKKNLSEGITLTNEGTITHSSSSVVLSDSTLNNSASGLYDLQGGTLTSRYFNIVQDFNNNGGILRKSADSSSTVGLFVTNNSGTVEVQQGLLTLRGGGQSNGTYTIESGSELEFARGEHRFIEDYQIEGDGTIRLSGGVLDVSSDGGASFDNFAGEFEEVGGTLYR